MWLMLLALAADPLPTPNAPSTLVMRERPLPDTAARCVAMSAYLRSHAPDLARAESDCSITPRVVVLHWTASTTSDAAWSTFAPVQLQGRPELQGAGDVNVGAHFLVERDGTVHRLLPDDVAARHVIGLNHTAIGVENVGGPDLPLTPEQVKANEAIVRMLHARWPIEYVIGHMEYRRLESTPLFHEVDPKYRTVKPDPGQTFVDAVRTSLADLHLRPLP